MKRILILLVGLAPVVGCSKPADKTSEILAKSPVAADAASTHAAFGLGDVEVAMRVLVRLDSNSKADNIRDLETESTIKKLTKVNIDVEPPFPKELWLTASFGSTENFVGHAVLVECSIFVEDKVVETLRYITGKDAIADAHQITFDALAGLDTVPETLLVHAEAKVTLFKDTDEATLNIDTLTSGGPDVTAIVYGNPVRIDFKST